MADSRRREPLRGAFIAIVAAAIAAGGTLAGNALASANARDQLAAQFEHEDRVRQDDIRRDVYERFIAVASKYQIDLRHAANSESNKELSSIRQDIINDLTQIQTVWSEVQLVGSAKAASLAAAVRTPLDDLAQGDAGGEELDRGVVQTFPKLRLFVDAAREELNG